MVEVLCVLSIVLALLAGVFGWSAYSDWRQKSKYREKLVKNERAASNAQRGAASGQSALASKVLELMRSTTKAESVSKRNLDANSGSSSGGSDETSFFSRTMFKSEWFCKHADKAGIAGQISERGFCAARLRLTCIFAAAGAIVGALFSGELAVILLLLGAVFGWREPKEVLARQIEGRAHQMEHHLPEMLDVMALGMRSGLSFDASIKLYTTHFKTYLAHEFANAQRQWLSGLEYRDEALRKIATSYDSQIFKRVIETVIRSVRFGSSMVESLEEQSAEARLAYRTRREEQVAKAPVKMMIPTGTLILPAMLILVVGPVLLELMGGGL